MDDVAETFKEEEFIAGIDEAIQHIVGPGSSEDSKIEDSEENGGIQTEQVKKALADVEEGSASELNLRAAIDYDLPNSDPEHMLIAPQRTRDGDHERRGTIPPLAGATQKEPPASSGLDVVEATPMPEAIVLAGHPPQASPIH